MLTQFEIIKILSEKSGLPMYKVLHFTDLEEARKVCGQPSRLKVFDANGKEYPYMDYGPGHSMVRFDHSSRDIKATRFEFHILRNVENFGFEVKFIRKTKMCEGGGWYSWGGLYEVEGMQFEQ